MACTQKMKNLQHSSSKKEFNYLPHKIIQFQHVNGFCLGPRPKGALSIYDAYIPRYVPAVQTPATIAKNPYNMIFFFHF